MTLRLAATGDSILTRRISAITNPDFLEVSRLLRSADVSFTNLEFTVPHEPWMSTPKNSGMSYTIHIGVEPMVLDELKKFGFNLYGGANNHSIDYCPQGLADTVSELAKRSMVCAGIGMDLDEAQEPKYLEVNDYRVAIVDASSTFTPGAMAGRARAGRSGRPGLNPLCFETDYILDEQHFAMLRSIDRALGTAEINEETRKLGLFRENGRYRFMDKNFLGGESCGIVTYPSNKDMERIERQIREARRQADFVVMSLHCHESTNGQYYSIEPADYIPIVAKKCIDSGADIFIGHGPHILRPLEIYKDKPIFYSLGNFFFTTETLNKLPNENYEDFNLDEQATTADVHDAWTKTADGQPKMFMSKEVFWFTILPICEFENGIIKDISVYPITLGQYKSRGQKGLPLLSTGVDGLKILNSFIKMSAPYGVQMRIVPGSYPMAKVIL